MGPPSLPTGPCTSAVRFTHSREAHTPPYLAAVYFIHRRPPAQTRPQMVNMVNAYSITIQLQRLYEAPTAFTHARWRHALRVIRLFHGAGAARLAAGGPLVVRPAAALFVRGRA